MKKILYVPLDERPCNYAFPQRIAAVRDDVEVIAPPMSIMGKKKQKADFEKIWEFVENTYMDCDAAVLSGETMFYGGLLQSRLHHMEESEKEKLIERIRALKAKKPDGKLYMFQLIMRTPKYSSSEEEPDYYEKFGESIFKRAYLLDKAERDGLSVEEQSELDKILSTLPQEYVDDYETRRAYNVDMNVRMLSLVKEGIVDLLYIPQDDSSEYGYTAKDQKIVGRYIAENRLQQKVYIYPGADEVGATMLSKAIIQMMDWKIKAYPFYASTLGPQVIPSYEDRPMLESLKSHCMAAGVEIVEDRNEAEYILAVNCPGKLMQESFSQFDFDGYPKDVTYSSWRNLNWFVNELSKDIAAGRKVIMADCAYCNGGDLELIALLDEYQILDKIVSYKGWNTHCNTLGTSIAQGVFSHGLESGNKKIKENIIYHVLDDALYQSAVRSELTIRFEETGEATYFNLGNNQAEIEKEAGERMVELFNESIRHSFSDMEITKCKVDNPWNRLFEIGIDLEVNSK